MYARLYVQVNEAGTVLRCAEAEVGENVASAGRHAKV